MRVLLLLIAASLMLASCKVTEQVYNRNTDTTVVRVRTDSVYHYVHDSIYIRERGDTVFVNRWQVRYIDKLKIERDTVVYNDSVTVDKTEYVKYTPKFYVVCTWLFWIIVVLIVFLVGIKLFRLR